MTLLQQRTTTPSPLAGAATSRGTARLAARNAATDIPPEAFRPFHGELTVSALGAGTYLGDADDATDARYREALVHALARGVNLLDTAINYRGQRAERVVGAALREAIATKHVHRDEVVVCTKGGYLALDAELPQTREAYRSYVEREFLTPRLIERDELVAGGHCLAPNFLSHQIARSRANLGVQRIDLYYLHNPEQQREARGPTAFRTILRQAAEVLEMKVAAGEITAWGVATWQGLRVPPDHASHLALAEVVAAAREVAGNSHHLRVVQLPINLAMPEAVRLPTQELPGGARVTALQAAADFGLAVVASAPLLQGRLTSGLPAALAATFPGCETDAQRALAFVQALPGVSAALCGMSRLEHVAENLGAFTAREAIQE
jgi:aryl-alcohol dehydrogenase-like predicted oxidoreductase